MTIADERSHFMPPQEDLEQLRRERLEDAAGFPVALADMAITGVDPDWVPFPQPKTATPHHTHRGGRAFPEWSGRDAALKLTHAEQGIPQAPEVVAARHQAYLRATEQFADTTAGSRHAELLRTAGRLGVAPQVLERARADKAARKQQ